MTDKLKWRENLHNNILSVMYPKKGSDGKFLSKLPPIIIDAIDSAYVAGLDSVSQDLEAAREEGYRDGLTDGQNNPMGVTKWKNYGIDFGYWEYFEKVCRREMAKEIIEAIPDEKKDIGYTGITLSSTSLKDLKAQLRAKYLGDI